MAYDAFISYSHAADGRLAPAVQTALQRLARPWYRLHALRVFRDDTGLSVNPHLWSSITAAMDESRFFVLMASPEAAASPWVNREIEHWCATKRADHILPVLTEGELVWDQARGDYDPVASSALPPALAAIFGDEPRHLDLRWARDETELDLRHSKFREAVADLAAPMHGIPKEELESEDVRRHRRAIALARTGVLSLLLFALAAVVASVFAVGNASRANAAADRERAAARRARTAESLARKRATEAEEARTAEATAADRARRAGDEAQLQAVNAAHQRDLAQAANLTAQQEADNARRAERDRAAEAARARSAARTADLAATAAAASAKEAADQRDEAARAADLAEQERARAEREAASALSRSVAASAHDAIRDGKLDLALLLGVDAARRELNVQTRSALASALEQPLDALIADHDAYALSPDGSSVAVSTGSSFAIRTLSTGATRSFPAPEPRGEIVDLTFSPDGRYLAVSSELGPIEVWDTASGSRLAALPRRLFGIAALAFTPDNRLLATADYDAEVNVWDLRAGTAVRTFRAFASVVALSPDGSVLAAVNSGNVQLWDVRSGEPLPGLSVDGVVVAPVTFDALGRTLTAAVASDGGAVVATWDLETGTRVDAPGEIVVPAQEQIVTLSPERRLVVTRDGERLLVRDALTGAVRAGPFFAPLVAEVTGGGLELRVEEVAFSADATVFAAGAVDGFVRVFDLARDGPRLGRRLPAATGADAAQVEVAPDSSTLAVVRTDGSVELVDVRSGRPLPNQPAARGDAFARPAWSADAHSLALVTIGGGIVTVDVVTGERRGPPVRPPGSCYGRWLGVALRFDGRTLAALCSEVGSLSAQIWIADVATGLVRRDQPFATQVSHGVTGLEFSDDGRQLVSAGFDFGAAAHVELWDAEAGRQIWRWDPSSGVSAVAIHPGGAAVVTGSYDGTVSIWTVGSDAPIEGQAAGHRGAVESVVVSPDGLIAASGGEDGQIRLWDIVTGRPVEPALAGHTGRVDDLAFAADGPSLVSAAVGPPGTAFEWDVDVDSWIHRACTIAARELTDAEWRFYVGPTVARGRTCG